MPTGNYCQGGASWTVTYLLPSGLGRLMCACTCCLWDACNALLRQPQPQPTLSAYRYAELIYNGFWFSPERQALQALVDETQKFVNGTVRLKLYKVGRLAVPTWLQTSSVLELQILLPVGVCPMLLNPVEHASHLA